MQIAPFDPSKKKKKKKVVIEDLVDDSVDKLAEKTENLAGDLLEQQLIYGLVFLFPSVLYMYHFRGRLIFLVIAVADGQDSSFSGLKKKKKKPVSFYAFLLSTS